MLYNYEWWGGHAAVDESSGVSYYIGDNFGFVPPWCMYMPSQSGTWAMHMPAPLQPQADSDSDSNSETDSDSEADSASAADSV